MKTRSVAQNQNPNLQEKVQHKLFMINYPSLNELILKVNINYMYSNLLERPLPATATNLFPFSHLSIVFVPRRKTTSHKRPLLSVRLGGI